jgi:hypothetical protein
MNDYVSVAHDMSGMYLLNPGLSGILLVSLTLP